MVQGLYEAMDEIEESTTEQKDFNTLFEDVAANATGAAVAGTGNDVADFKKPDARKKDMKAFLKRYLDQKQKRVKIKERKDFMKKFGL